jgi:catechol 2,3-dioxygenase-like lactoylglutathione lyase family enzyme
MIRRAIPVVVVSDPGAAREFYRDFLGMRVAMDEDGMTMFASTTVPTTQLIVAWPSPTAVDPALTDVDVSFEVDDVDAARTAADRAGWTVVRETRDEPWGIRRFFVRDPSGRTIDIAGHI